MDYVRPIVNVIGPCLVSPLVQQFNYLTSSSDNVNSLQTVVQDLKARRNDEQSKLKAEEDAGQEKTDVASNWFKAVHEIEMEADVIEREFHQGTCAGGWCINCWSRYKLSKRSLSLKLKAEERLKEQFAVARQPPPKHVIEMPTPPIENQTSTQRMLRQILDCIGDPKIGIIGVYGMGGVGKTTLAKGVNNHFEKEDQSSFETVIMVTVSATPNIVNIQSAISKRLGLPPDKSDAIALLDGLRKKKFLLILDDMWFRLNLEDVGIPHPAGNNKKGSKILVISRSQDTCTDMGASKTIKVQPLSEAESWELFIKVAGAHVAAKDIKHFAGKIVGKCQGLPLAIVTTARAMANRHGAGSWENALRELALIRGMKEQVFVPLKFSFDKLEDDMLKSLFLYCACFPEDYDISYSAVMENEILNFCVGNGLVDKLGSLKAAKDKGEDLIESLKIASMLEDGEKEGTVRMHDMMRELALWITSSEYSDRSGAKFLVKIGESVREAPQAHEWVDASIISLINTQIEQLPKLEQMCQKLTIVLFRSSLNLNVIPQTNFFLLMDHLSVLDLSHSYNLEYLPDSLSCLVNLRVLILQCCFMLRRLPTLEMLRQLQVLNCSSCLMLSEEIQVGGSECEGGVSNLRCLNLENTDVSIPRGVISRLHKLEELRLCDARNIKWKVSSTSGDDNNIILHDVEELSHLTYLTSLSFDFFDITISDWFKPLANKIMGLRLRGCTVARQDALQALNHGSPYLQWLVINNCPGVTSVPICVQTNLSIMNCDDLEKVLDGADMKEVSLQVCFRGLLNLVNLQNLKSICVGDAPADCFAQLSTIQIDNCNSLKMVFTKGMPRLYNNLETISVQNCEKMEAIIEQEAEEELKGSTNSDRINNGGVIIISPFPRLKFLRLFGLPELHDVCSGNHILHCPLIKIVRVSGCPKLKKDPLRIQNPEGGLLVMPMGVWVKHD